MRRPAAFTSLEGRDYRLYALGLLVSAIGNGAQRVALIWLVLELTDGSGTAVGISVGLQWAPTLVLGMWGGVVADRYDNRRTILLTQACLAACALALGVAVVLGEARPWLVYAVSAAYGLFVAVDNPVRAALLGEIVAPAEIPSAVSLQSMIGTVANIVGPALAGVLVGVAGTAPVFLANAASFGALIGAVCLMGPTSRRARPGAERPRLRSGFAQLRRDRDLCAVLALILVLSTIGLNWQTLVALITVGTYGHSASSFGLLSALFGVGAVLGALLTGSRTRVRLRTIVVCGALCGATQVLGAAVHAYALFAASLVAIGATWVAFNMSAYAYVQLRPSPAARGRTLALYFMAATAGTPLAGPAMGWLADHAGPRVALLANGVVGLAVVLVVGSLLARAHARTRAREAVAAVDALPRLH